MGSEDETVTLRATEWQLYVARADATAEENARLIAERDARIDRERLREQATAHAVGWHSTEDAPAVIRFWDGHGWLKSRFVPGVPGDTFVGYRAARIFVWFFAFCYSLIAWLAVFGIAVITAVTGYVVLQSDEVLLKVTGLFSLVGIVLLALLGWFGFRAYAAAFYLRYLPIIMMVVLPTAAIGIGLFINWVHLQTVAHLVAPLFALILASAPYALVGNILFWLVGVPQ